MLAVGAELPEQSSKPHLRTEHQPASKRLHSSTALEEKQDENDVKRDCEEQRVKR